ncbi:hypothetical protein FACS1894142_4340 [Spirochaetia bacterium]|nr:hypothetical protein FACS1894142_4340 [Spirochaetia bacterium]
MTMRQTIDIPANRKVHFDLVVPETIPCGKREVILDFPQEPGPYKPGPVKSLRGILKGRGITGEEFEEMQREDLLLEEQE